jgi:endonuclease III
MKASTKARDILIEHGEKLLAEPLAFISFTEDSNADTLLNDIDNYPHAFVLACLMDRQQKATKCWLIPYRIQQKIGSFEFKNLARLSQARITTLMTKPEPLHRFTEIMAGVFYRGIRQIELQYAGDASKIWDNTPSSATIVRRFLEFDGAGQKIATMAANLLVRHFKIPVSDKYSIDVSVDVHVRRVFRRLGFVRNKASNEEIIYTARELNPAYPGVFDLPTWEVGQAWCHEQNPECLKCYLRKHCPTAGG